MLDGTAVTLAIPSGLTASEFINSLRLVGGTWDIPADQNTAANWWPYKDWKKAVTS
jgi:hypothetical protein